MGQEIVYCFKCSSRIVTADLDRGEAVQIGNRTCCALCLPSVLSELPEAEREAALGRLGNRQPGRKTPRGGTEISSTRTPRMGTPSAPPPNKSGSPPLLALAGGAVVVLALLAYVFAGGDRKGPEPEPAAKPPPVEPPKPEGSPREKSALAAITKARDAGRAGVDIDAQVQLWDEAVFAAERTPRLDEATRERELLLERRKEVYKQELTQLMNSVDGMVRQDLKNALAALASARKRHTPLEWTGPIDRKVDEIQKEAAKPRPFVESAEADNLLVFEAEHFTGKVDRSDHSWTVTTSIPGASGDGAVAALPGNGLTVLKDWVTLCPQIDFAVVFVKPGKHYLWIRAYAENEMDNSVHAGLDGAESKPTSHIAFSAAKKWVWTNKCHDSTVVTINVAAPGPHVINLWMREDGAIVDRIVITTNAKYVPKDAGPPESSR